MKRARTPVQKAELMVRLAKVWDMAPELRLGQLICNVKSDPYYTEDYTLIELLEQFYERREQPRGTDTTDAFGRNPAEG